MGELRWGTVIYDEMRPGARFQRERLLDMDANHVDASVCFPNTLPRFCGQTFAERDDKELALLCVRAYNDWIVEDWCAGDGYGRLIPLTMVPLWDVDLAVEELRRCVEMGAYAVTFPENPYSLGLPSVYSGEWDPFFAECAATGTVLCLHIGSSSTMPQTQPEAPFIVTSTLQFQNSMHSVLDFTFSGTLAKHPELRLAYAEGQIGWLPFVIERADRLWAERSENSFGTNGVILDEPPSAYARRQVFGCIFDDEAGLAVRDRVGPSNICFEVDYPHADSTYPLTEKVLSELCDAAGLDDDEIYRLARERHRPLRAAPLRHRAVANRFDGVSEPRSRCRGRRAARRPGDLPWVRRRPSRRGRSRGRVQHPSGPQRVACSRPGRSYVA